MNNIIVGAITCTRGRHSLLERCVANFLEQDYEGMAYQIIFNNSSTEQSLGEFHIPDNRKIILINQNRYSKGGNHYLHINEIFEDAMSYVPEDVELITFFDDDDVFLPNHLSEGVRGWIEGGTKAYKPYFSLIQTKDGIELMHNMAEPSWFVEKSHVQEYGFSTHSAAYHHQWINPLIDRGEFYEARDGISTFVYQWMGGCFHISGDGENPENLANHNKYSLDEGDGIIIPNFGK